MPTSPKRRLVRATLFPSMVVWSLVRLIGLPGGRLKYYIRKHRRGIRKGPQARPKDAVDGAATASILARPGPHVVFIGAGLGEFITARRMTAALLKERPEAKISYTLRDNSAFTYVREHHPELNLSYWPQDSFLNALRWLSSQQPDVAVIVENFRYPMFLATANRYGARVALVNARVFYRKSFDLFFRRPFYRRLFGGFAAMAMQTERDRATVAPLVSPTCDLQTVGDVKLDACLLDLAPARRAALDRWIEGDLPIVAAGSTNNLEEERMVIDAFLEAQSSVPCRLLLAPRQTVGQEALLAYLAERGLSVSRRSREEGAASVLLLDTQGELATAYGASVAAYVGGSYHPLGGGHNIVEPLAWGIPVAYGMHRKGFEAVQVLAEEKEVGVRIGNAEELAAFWVRYLMDEAARDQARVSSLRLIEENRGAVSQTVKMLMTLMDRASSEREG